MRVTVELGATLNLGNYNSGRVTIRFDDEIAEKELELTAVHANVNGFTYDRKTAMNELADELYLQVEAKLLQKIELFVTRLEQDGLV